MKKYLVTLDENSIEIVVDSLTESNVYNAVSEKFGLFGTYIMNLKFIQSMNIHTLTLTKRGSATTLLIKEVVKEVVKETQTSTFDIQKFNADIDSLLNGGTNYVNVKNVSKYHLDTALINKGFTEFGKDTDNDDEIIYYFGHEDWDVNDDGEYFNRLNVKFDLTDLSVEIDLEDGYSKIEDFKAAKKEILEKRTEIVAIEKQIEKLEDEKRDLESDIEDLESDLSSDLYY